MQFVLHDSYMHTTPINSNNDMSVQNLLFCLNRTNSTMVLVLTGVLTSWSWSGNLSWSCSLGLGLDVGLVIKVLLTSLVNYVNNKKLIVKLRIDRLWHCFKLYKDKQYYSFSICVQLHSCISSVVVNQITPNMLMIILYPCSVQVKKKFWNINSIKDQKKSCSNTSEW